MQENMKHTQKSSRKLILLSALLSAVLTFTSILYSSQVTGWFTVRTSVDNPAKISNFVTEVQYLNPSTSTWTKVDAGQPIKITASQDVSLQVRLRYRGFSAAYVRVSVFGGFMNKNTGTHLPQSDLIWGMDSNSKWIKSGNYLYYPEVLQKKDAMNTLTSFNVEADLSSAGVISEHQEYESELYILVEAVQPDRISSHWGITSLPTAS